MAGRQIGYRLGDRVLCPRFCFFKLNGADKDAAVPLTEAVGEDLTTVDLKCECGEFITRNGRNGACA